MKVKLNTALAVEDFRTVLSCMDLLLCKSMAFDQWHEMVHHSEVTQKQAKRFLSVLRRDCGGAAL